jgi:hypothetical protein
MPKQDCNGAPMRYLWPLLIPCNNCADFSLQLFRSILHEYVAVVRSGEVMRKIGWVASSLVACAIFPCASRAEGSIDFAKYTCAQFLADTADKADGNKLVRSLVANSRAIASATARQKAVPLADSEAMSLMAAALRNACRNAPDKTIARAIVRVIAEFNSARAQSKAPAKGSTASALSVYWNHNGSLVSLVSDGAKQKIYYQAPRVGLVDAGVKTGSLLFEGQKNGPALVGTAYLFYRSCKPRGYQVSGNTSEDRRQITLKGKAPQLDSSCNITGSRDDVLVFTAHQITPKEPPKNTQAAGTPVASAAAHTPSSAGAANNSAIAGAVVPSAPPAASRAADLPITEGGNSKAGAPAAAGNAASAASAVSPSEPPKDKDVTTTAGQPSATAPPSEPAKDTQLTATPQNASNAANSSAAATSVVPSGEPAKDNQPSASPAADNATPKSDVSTTANEQQGGAAPPSEPPKDAQVAALPGAVNGAAKTDDASKADVNKSKNSTATGGVTAPRNSRTARRSEASGADADKTGALPANASEKMMEIVLKNGRVLRIGRDIDPEALLRLIALLER